MMWGWAGAARCCAVRKGLVLAGCPRGSLALDDHNFRIRVSQHFSRQRLPAKSARMASSGMPAPVITIAIWPVATNSVFIPRSYEAAIRKPSPAVTSDGHVGAEHGGTRLLGSCRQGRRPCSDQGFHPYIPHPLPRLQAGVARREGDRAGRSLRSSPLPRPRPARETTLAEGGRRGVRCREPKPLRRALALRVWCRQWARTAASARNRLRPSGKLGVDHACNRIGRVTQDPVPHLPEIGIGGALHKRARERLVAIKQDSHHAREHREGKMQPSTIGVRRSPDRGSN